MIEQMKSWVSPTEKIVNEVKELYPQDKWNKEIKTRIKTSITKQQKPEPENEGIIIDDYTRAMADKICATHFSPVEERILISRFVRNKPSLVNVKVCLKTGTILEIFDKGSIIGALVGLKVDELVIVGWSVYNKNHEEFPFTRKDAIRVAIIRGLADGLIAVSETMWKTMSGIQIPKNIAIELPDFITRVKKYYYNKPIANLK